MSLQAQRNFRGRMKEEGRRPIQFWCTEKDLRKLDKLAQKEGRSRQQQFRLLVEQMLADLKG